MIRSMQTEDTTDYKFLIGAEIELSRDIRRAKTDHRITCALQHILMHVLIASGASAFTTGSGYLNEPIGRTTLQVETYNTVRQLESTVHRVKNITQSPLDGRL